MLLMSPCEIVFIKDTEHFGFFDFEKSLFDVDSA